MLHYVVLILKLRRAQYSIHFRIPYALIKKINKKKVNTAVNVKTNQYTIQMNGIIVNLFIFPTNPFRMLTTLWWKLWTLYMMKSTGGKMLVMRMPCGVGKIFWFDWLSLLISISLLPQVWWDQRIAPLKRFFF